MLLKTAVRNFCAGYFATCQRSEKTKQAYTADLLQFTNFARPRTRLTSIGSEVVERWAQSLQSEGYAPASMRRKMASLRVFFLYWVRKKRLESSPMWQLRLSFAAGSDLPKCLTEREVKLLFRCAHRLATTRPADEIDRIDGAYRMLRNLALINLLFATGVRVGEASALDVDDFQRDNRSLIVRGKGGRMRLAFLTEDVALQIQLEYLAVRGRLGPATQALFLNGRGRRLSTQGMAYALSSVASAAGLARHVTPHMMRHTVATLLLENGADIRAVQEFLGHRSIASTQRYTHVAKRHLLSTLRRCHPSARLLKTLRLKPEPLNLRR